MLSKIYKMIESGDYKNATIEIKKLNDFYRNGAPQISDFEYDKLIEALKSVDSSNELFDSGVIEVVNSERKEKLQYPMFSLDKETNIKDIHKWLKNKGLSNNIELVITAKYDGISILKDENKQLAWSRGDGVYGEKMHDHYKMLKDNSKSINVFTIGEMIIPKKAFSENSFYRDNGEPFKNARNMIAGLKNSDTISKDLKYAKHIRYGFANEDFTMNKSEQLEFINTKFSKVPYKILKASELKLEELNELFLLWGKEYDIDGLVIDIEDKNIRKQLGRERNNNPAYSRAYKDIKWFQSVETTILDIEWAISKQGLLKPIALLESVDLEGVKISRVTLNNAKFVKDMNIGPFSRILLTRSGGVIPKVIGVIEATGFSIPKIEGYEVKWNENDVELIVDGTEDQKIKEIISFFEILGTENVSEGIVKQLFKSGYTNIKSILEMSISDFEKLDKFGKRKADIVYNNIKKSTTDVNLAKLMHASNMFVGLGSKKLDLVCHFTEKPTVEEIVKIEGFSDISANAFIEGYDMFYEWLKTVPQITIETKKEESMETTEKRFLEGTVWVFTGVRLKSGSEEEKKFNELGGTIGSAVSKNTTHLVSKDTSVLTGKLQKAKDMGIKIMSLDEFYEMLKELD